MVNIPLAAYSGGAEFRAVVENAWLPALHEFAPQMIFVSAGFDAHRDDDMASLGLVENDYAWVTRQIVEVADRYADGRIISTLEGGYNLPALARSVAAHIRELCRI
jgi:acetoin utilization deacetylase AcuC-like enzyme